MLNIVILIGFGVFDLFNVWIVFSRVCWFGRLVRGL